MADRAEGAPGQAGGAEPAADPRPAGAATKAALRRALRARRDGAGRAQREAVSAAIARRLRELEAYRRARTVLFYVAVGSEVETRPLMEEALAAGKRVCVPYVDRERREIVPAQIASLEELRPGAFGIPAPQPEGLRPVDPWELDAVLVPGLAFDLSGRRLGYGGGYYDRLYARIRGAAAAGATSSRPGAGGPAWIGLAPSAQVVPTLPEAAHDLRVDWLVTEREVLATGEDYLARVLAGRGGPTAGGQAVHPIARLIDHTVLRPEAGPEAVRRAAAEAVRCGFAAVCVGPRWVPLAAEVVAGSPVAVCTVVGFPLGIDAPNVKAFAAGEAARAGAREVDVVLPIGALKAGDLKAVQEELAAVVEEAAAHGALVKVILETGLLTDAEKVTACQLAQEAGAAAVKTSTGMGPGGATEADVRLLRQAVGWTMSVKAAGGIRTLEQALALVRAGADRIGTSAGVAIACALPPWPAADEGAGGPAP